MMTTSIEALWEQLLREGQPGGARRVDETHPCNLYAALDPSGCPGLILVSDVALPVAPTMDSVEAVVSQRHDGRWSLGIWLRVDALRSPFGRLCEDLVDATLDVPSEAAGGFILARLARWRRLLEAGADGMNQKKLRGLVGELVVLRRCLEIWPAPTVVDSWVGPLGAPQDFTLPNFFLESKAVRPGSASVSISSVDQLDASGRLVLAVVALASVSPEDEGFEVAELVDEIRLKLSRADAHIAALELDSRLAAAGYRDGDVAGRARFRADSIRFFDVRDGFPAIRRADLPEGVSEASYEIELGSCGPFEVELTA
jgi:hypothetical protein